MSFAIMKNNYTKKAHRLTRNTLRLEQINKGLYKFK